MTSTRSADSSVTLAFLPEHFEDYEVIAVNDGSSDGTGAILEQLRSEFPERFRVVTHETNGVRRRAAKRLCGGA